MKGREGRNKGVKERTRKDVSKGRKEGRVCDKNAAENKDKNNIR